MEVHRGEVFYADLSPVVGSEQGGVRPVLIVQNEIGNRHSPTVIAAAITSRLDKARLPTHINIRAADTGLAKDSVVLLEQIRTLDKHRLREPFSLCEIEAVRQENGAPAYRFSGQTAAWVAQHRLRARLSLSHEGGMALAFCTLEEES
jgi:mRNA interferase MazF